MTAPIPSARRSSRKRATGCCRVRPGSIRKAPFTRSNPAPTVRSRDREGDAAGDVSRRAEASAAAGDDVMQMVGPSDLKAMLADGQELAILDLREELIFSRAHLLWARSVPLR